MNNSEQVKLSPEMVEQIQHSTNEHLNTNGYEPFRIQDGCLISSCSSNSDVINFSTNKEREAKIGDIKVFFEKVLCGPTTIIA